MPALVTPPSVPPKTVYYFGTCLIDLFYPAAGLAGMELLKRQGLRVVFPQSQSCCGQPAYNSGHRDEAREVARAQLDAFPEDWPIVVPSGSCAGMMRVHYPDLFAGDRDHARAIAFAGRVYELSWFLVHVVGLDEKLVDRGEKVQVTWHGSCHSMREMGVVDEPKRLLRGLANVTLVENPREKECCGFGGTFAVRQPEISAAMVADKINAIGETGAARVVSGDCGCLMNIGGALDKAGKPIRAQHLAEFLLERCHEE
ncbi:putative L-lactate dehydrogenase, Fe-S oxidoreductase subunit [Magnetospirillum gryphiswaldense MSR-1 v2]|uniref:L-lactate dehydrogenase, Fe-S oxidoreductase subunit n=1 Tax=Magnetospirillum gryphiswaldense (strain DSM 6361 / JCM 21280 / NBRC 15271 / MSR-1) TaxID=431944 RepID=V6F0W0_MAGGM|nr:(Fe-S)-binding protein [Magnetospirillum gryphiswaldense]CDK99027.1 putative L-lactate dehydrogenase, Fe-S oxidoreductase subunit [Magnetospirillum gryphiswaldense MSR-1 v2]